MMTLKKALKGIDIYLDVKKQLVDNIENEIKKWPSDKASSLAETLVKSLKTDIEFLQVLKRQLTSNHSYPKKPTCKHPKKFRDIDPTGKLYCTECNQDL